MTKYPFEATQQEIQRHPDHYVAAVFACLESEFLVMPKGEGFVEYSVFERGYEALKIATRGFSDFQGGTVFPVIISEPISLIVLRTMLGFTPPEWGYVATQEAGILIPQGFARTLDRKIRMSPDSPLKVTKASKERLKALVDTACRFLNQGMPTLDEGQLHRLNKADTKNGLNSIKSIVSMGVPYAMLLYERLLGRPFAGHRDSVSELIGDSLETVIEDVLTNAGVSYRKTRRAEKIEGFDQSPDFIIPSEFNPLVVIEAKITEDDGTARDKVTRIQHLSELSQKEGSRDDPRFELIACIAGRGFGVRREDMRKMLLATRGKVFTLKTLDKLVEFTRIREFRTK